jgi:cytochrome c-type biogenesis protein CcmH
MKRFTLITLCVVAFSALWVGVVSAQQPTPSNDDVNRIARQMYCPVCENTPLDVCATQACAQWRALIREKLAAGWTDEQIKQYFVEQYGVRVLAEPPSQGWYALIYIIPPVLFVLGVVILYRAFVSMRKPAALSVEAGTTTTPASGDDEYLHRVEEELRMRK